MPFSLRIVINLSSVDLVFRDLTLAIILERSDFENVSTVKSLDNFYPGGIKMDSLKKCITIKIRWFFNSY